MGAVFGRIAEELPPHTVLYTSMALVHGTSKFEVRLYPSQVAVAADYAADWGSGKDGRPFGKLAKYIGVFGSAANVAAEANKSQKIAMTAPVLITQGQDSKAESQKIAMTAPVLIDQGAAQGGRNTMMFLLPASKYSLVEHAPRPTDPAVRLMQIPERTLAVRTFNGNLRPERCREQLNLLVADVEEDGKWVVKRTSGGGLEWQVAGYNSPFTIPYFKTNEVLLAVESAKGADVKEVRTEVRT